MTKVTLVAENDIASKSLNVENKAELTLTSPHDVVVKPIIPEVPKASPVQQIFVYTTGAGISEVITETTDDGNNVVKFVLSNGDVTSFVVKNGRDGIDGKDGKDGKDGQDGTDGKSAYEIWQENGHANGKYEDFINAITGPRGEGFSIKKYYNSYDDMINDQDNEDVPNGSFVIIQSNVDDPHNAELYLKLDGEYKLQADMSGATGIGITDISIKDTADGKGQTITITYGEGASASYASFTIPNPVDGTGIEDIYIGENGHLYVTLTGETTVTDLGKVVGKDGDDGITEDDVKALISDALKDVGGGQLPENVVTDVLVNGTSVVDDGVANIDLQTLTSEYITVTEEDTDEYVWRTVSIAGISFPALCVPSVSPLANAQKIYNSDGQEIVFYQTTIVIDNIPQVVYAVGKKGTYKLALTSGMVLGGDDSFGEPSVILTVKYTSNQIVLRNLKGVTFIDWGDGRTTTAKDSETEFMHIYALERSIDVWFEIRIYGCTEIGDDAFNMIGRPDDYGNYAIQSITVKSDVRKIGKNIVHSVYPVTVIMDRLVPPKIADVVYLANSPVGTNPGVTSFPANVTKIVVPNEEVVERYTKYWQSFYTSIIKASIIDKQKWYRLSGTVEIYDANSVKATSFGIQAVAKNFASLSGAGIPLLTSLLSDTVGMVSFSMYSGDDFAPISIRSDFVGVSGINISTNEFVCYGSDCKLYLVSYTEEEI